MNHNYLMQCVGFLLFVCSSITWAQNGVITGTVQSAANQSSLESVQVTTNGGTNTTTDAEGLYKLDLPYGTYTLTFTLDRFDTEQLTVVLKQEELSLDLILLTPQSGGEIIGGEDFIPTISLSDTDSGSAGEQDVSGLLTASRDVFVSTAAFSFGAARFRIRGYDSENTEIYLNNAPMNDLETGRTSWSTWGGLNDVLRNRESSVGLNPMWYTFGGVGGGSSMDASAGSQRKGLKASYALANRSYRNRVMLTYSTRKMSNGWAFTLSGSRRWAQEGYVAGTFYDAWAYFASAEKQINKKHALHLTAFGAPIKRGKSGPALQEMYDLSGDNYYNPYWGYQNGEKRNSRVATTHQPVFIVGHKWAMSDQASLKTSVSYQFGRNGSTALDWYGARDPRPDYYRKLPSYIEDSTAAALVGDLLRNNEELRQLDWSMMYNANYNSNETIENVDGIDGNNVTGKRAKYIVEDRRYDSRRMNFNTVYENIISNKVTLNAGLNYRWHEGQNFKILDDLLGGEFYVDINRFAERDFADNPDAIQNDLNNPNRILEVGDRFGYDYDTNIRKAGAWLQTQFNLNKFELFLAGDISNTQFWRTGNVQNGLFPNDSFGDAEKQSFLNYGAKAGATFKINGRNYLYANGAYLTRAPYYRNAYVSPRTRNQLAPNLGSELIKSAEGGYLLRSPYVKARATAYFTQFENQTKTSSFYHDEERSFVNFTLSGINKQHIGTELAVEAKIMNGLKATAVAAVGQYIYTSRPTATVTQDNDSQVLVQDRTIYAKNFYLSGSPQSAYSMGLNYRAAKFWFASVNFNYFDDMWLDFNPDRRTVVATELVDPDSDLWKDILFQEQVNSAFTLDASFGKSWLLNNFFENLERRYFVNLNIGVNNILNNQFATGGFEQLRFDYLGKEVNKFPPKYFYSYGTNFFASLSFRM